MTFTRFSCQETRVLRAVRKRYWLIASPFFHQIFA